MLQQYHTKLKGTLALTDSYLTEKALQKKKDSISLYGSAKEALQ